MLPFCHLHCHTEYSLLDGAIRIPKLLEKAKSCEMEAVAITDHGTLFGALDFYLQAKKAGIKPIIGCEVYVAPESIKDKGNDEVKSGYHLVLLAENSTGFGNLVKLVSHAYLEGFYYKPRVDKELLQTYSEGLIALSGCMQGEVAMRAVKDGLEAAAAKAFEYSEIFPGRFYLEVQANEIIEQENVNLLLSQVAQKTGLPLVATNDCHYLNPEDKESHDALLCVQTNKQLDDKSRMQSVGELSFKTPEEMHACLGEQYKEAIENTVSIARLCDIELDLDTYKFPAYQPQHANTLEDEFRELCRQGLRKRLEKSPVENEEKYWERLELEILTIEDMGFPGYFLIVQDFINWSKAQGIPVGPGRGSAAGSLASYALGITNIDPIPYNLLFERFLNKDRISMPDIDVDFCERRREEVLRYVSDKYGHENVAQITTFGTMKAKGAIRDVGRVLGLSFPETDRLSKMIPDEAKDLSQSYEMSEEIQEECKKQEVERLFGIAKKLEGISRHASTHAAGVVIADKPLDEYVPLYRGRNSEVVSQLDMNMLEKIGLIKFDFLGLRTMTVINDAVTMVRENHGVELDIDDISLSDPEVFKLYSEGATEGVFQVESPGMKKYLKQMQPNDFEDIIAMLALYRPGPLGSGMVDQYMQRKKGFEKVEYLFPELEDILKPTYGIILYQEQVMQIAQAIAGYTLGQADILRKAMGKKKADVMEAERSKFVEGGVLNGYARQSMKHLFETIEKFAAYGFNKSHSAAYALISYQTAYLKCYYPSEFMAALLTSESSNHNKIMSYAGACLEMGIKLKLPDINKSHKHFTVEEKDIRYGLGAIKNLGDKNLFRIIDDRDQKGPYKNLLDVMKRTKINKKAVESLVCCGTFDSFGGTRKFMSENVLLVSEAIKKEKNKSKKKVPNQVSLLSLINSEGKEDGKDKNENKGCLGVEVEVSESEWSNTQLLKKEKDLLGVFVSSHPLAAYLDMINANDMLTNTEECHLKKENETVYLPCMITEVRHKNDKKDKKMAFLKVADTKGNGSVVVFSSVFCDVSELITQDNLIVVEGQKKKNESKEDELNIIAKNIHAIDEFIKKNPVKKNCKNEEKKVEIQERPNADSQDVENKNQEHVKKLNHETKEKAETDDTYIKEVVSQCIENACRDIDGKKSENKKATFKENGKCCIEIEHFIIKKEGALTKLKDVVDNYEGTTDVVLKMLNVKNEDAQGMVKIAFDQKYRVHFCLEFEQEIMDWVHEHQQSSNTLEEAC